MSAALPATREPSARRGAYVNLAVVLGVLAIVIPLALHATQPPPPSVAEFAPEAKQIKQPPKELAGLVGKAGGSGALGARSVLVSPSPQVIDTASVHHCIGDPPRQIEDPQSPPCVPYWQGNNGGATSKGVDGSTVKVWVWDINWTDKAQYSWHLALAKFFNERFEFYGRKLQFIYNSDQGVACAQDTPDIAQKNAVYVISKGVFASTEYCTAEGAEVPYYQALAKAHIISTLADATRMGEDDFYGPLDPYVWNAIPGVDTIERNVADWTCRGLEGKPARWAGDPVYQRTTRKFGLVYSYFDNMNADYQLLLNLLAACGHPIDSHDVVGFVTGNETGYAASVAQLKQDNVTSVICLCDNGYSGTFLDAAHGAGYLPEWFYTSYYQGESEVHSETFWPPDEAAHVFEMSFLNKKQTLSNTPWYWGCKEGDPSGCNDEILDTTQAWYSSLLILASGIQMAGPNLTPSTFKNGLDNTKFPDPGAGAPPYYQAGVSFGPDHSFNDDGALLWYSPTTTSAETGKPGAFCYANHGQRYTLGQWPASDDMLFTGSCY